MFVDHDNYVLHDSVRFQTTIYYKDYKTSCYQVNSPKVSSSKAKQKIQKIITDHTRRGQQIRGTDSLKLGLGA